FPQACYGSAVVDEQGHAVGILIPGPYVGTLGDSEQDRRLFGNAVQKLASLPAQALTILFEAALKQALYHEDNPVLLSLLPYLKLLCDSGSDMMIVAAKTGNIRFLDTLLSISCTRPCLDVNMRNKSGDALLHALMHQKNYNCLKRLFLCPGFSVNIQDGKGRTALHLAVDAGEQATVELMLQHGSNVNVRDQHGEPPLFEAVRKSNVPVSRSLLEHDAWTGLSMVEQKQIKELVKASADKSMRHLFRKYH
ncbi:MAG: ankyrin repeat domain-containing protein, partial [Bacteroidetes bacterium]|nr:ankyrin repeat domain-containing protein [Bacteroidota bacterium]